MRYRRFDIIAITLCGWLAALSALTSDQPHRNGGVWFFGVGAILLVVLPWIRRERQPLKERVAFDDHEIRRFLRDGRMESIQWSEIHEIGIVTTDDGPWVEDVFWVFMNSDGSKGCAIPNDAEGFAALLPRLQRLPGFDNEAVVQAMGSATDNKFVVWRAESVPQSSAGHASAAG